MIFVLAGICFVFLILSVVTVVCIVTGEKRATVFRWALATYAFAVMYLIVGIASPSITK